MFKKLKRAALGAPVPHRKGTAAMATQKLPVPAQVVLPMAQHIGAPAKPVVKKGDPVFVGTLVGEAAGAMSANIHSSVSGTVSGIGSIRLSNGRTSPTVIIDSDGKMEKDPSLCPPVVNDRESLLKAAADCGLVGLGGAGFPAAIKLAPKSPVDTLVINGAECEPYLTGDTREFLENSETVMAGIEAVKKYLDIKNCIIGIERNKPECIDLMCSLTKGMEGVRVHPLKSRYPQGAEKVLIESTTGREVPQGGLPSDAGVIVLNVTTVSTLGKYLATGMPLTSRRVTVDGDAVQDPKNLEVPVGTSIREVLDYCGIKENVTVGKVLMGGPMMGVAVADLEAPVLKQNNGILAFSVEAAHLPEPSPCIRCGRCLLTCPMGLSPVELAAAYEKKDAARLAKLDVDLCMLCGSCSYVCPAKRPLTQTISLAKNLARKENGK